MGSCPRWLTPASSSVLQLIQNRVHLYNFLLLKILLFNHWVTGLAQEARGDSSRPAHTLLGALGQALHAGVALSWVPVWLLLRGPRLVWAAMLGCARTVGLTLQRLGLSAASCGELLLSCLHSLMLVTLLLALLTWRLFQKVHRCSRGWLPDQVGRFGV